MRNSVLRHNFPGKMTVGFGREGDALKNLRLRRFRGKAYVIPGGNYCMSETSQPVAGSTRQEDLMADSLKIDFRGFEAVEGGDLVVFVGENLKLGAALAKRLGSAATGLVAKAAAAEKFK